MELIAVSCTFDGEAGAVIRETLIINNNNVHVYHIVYVHVHLYHIVYVHVHLYHIVYVHIVYVHIVYVYLTSF